MRFSISVLIAATGLSGALASPTVSARQAPGTFDTFSSPDCSADRSVVDTNRDGPPFGQLAGGIQSIISYFPPNCARESIEFLQPKKLAETNLRQ